MAFELHPDGRVTATTVEEARAWQRAQTRPQPQAKVEAPKEVAHFMGAISKNVAPKPEAPKEAAPKPEAPKPEPPKEEAPKEETKEEAPTKDQQAPYTSNIVQAYIPANVQRQNWLVRYAKLHKKPLHVMDGVFVAAYIEMAGVKYSLLPHGVFKADLLGKDLRAMYDAGIFKRRRVATKNGKEHNPTWVYEYTLKNKK